MATRDRAYVGLAATLHDPAIALVASDGNPIFAEGAERPLQSKRAFNCPADDLRRAPQLLREHGLDDAEIIAAVSWSDGFLSGLDAWASRPRELPVRTHGAAGHFVQWPLPHAIGLSIGLRNSVSLAGLNLWASTRVAGPVSIRRFDHHLTHAANAACTSPFDECTVAVVDGYGEHGSVATYMYERGRLRRLDPAAPAGELELERESLGHFYARLCALCGFDPLAGEEWKVMGLAAHGRADPKLCDLLSIIRVDGLQLQRACDAEQLHRRLDSVWRIACEAGDDPVARADVAASGQHVFEQAMSELLCNLHARSPSPNLALAGGCALNSSFNGKLLDLTPFEKLHVPSAPADDGNALGAAFVACMQDGVEFAASERRAVPYLGSSLDRDALDRLERHGGFERLTRSSIEETIARAAALLAEGKIVAWVQGRAEFGPRALGNRSILADPRPADIQDRINQKVKLREGFRPFAPSILDQAGPDYFESYRTSRYMERTLRFRPAMRHLVPGVVHVDGTGRLQSVRRDWNPRFHDLIEAFRALTGIPLLLNTSLNIMGKPIVHSLEDCLGVFLTTGIDVLVVEDIVVEK
jgi:carbamoyltransferase